MAKSKQMFVARQMRREGESIKKIAQKIHVSVSSVSVWCRDINLTENQKEILTQRMTDPNYGKKLEYRMKKKEEFDLRVSQLREQGRREVGKLTKREIFLTGIALYWGEGFKKDHLVGMATSDPRAANFFIHWLNVCFGIPPKNLIVRVTANISHTKRIKTIEQYWQKTLHLPKTQFSKPYFQKTKWKKEYENKESYFGVIRIKVRKSISLLRNIYGYMEAIAQIN